MRQRQRRDRDRSICAEYARLLNEGVPVWEAKEMIAKRFRLCTMSVHRILGKIKS